MAKNDNKDKNKKDKMPFKDKYGSDDLATAQKEYFKDVLGASSQYGNKLYLEGLPGESKYTQAYYAGVPSLYKYGDKEQAKALSRSGNLYKDYGKAGEYDKTKFADFERKYGRAGDYDTGQFEQADYTTQNIQERMSPYEQLVAERNRARLKRTYDEARGEREAQAARAGAFGGSGAAIQEELARRNYAEQLKDLDAQSLQAAFESGAGLYSKEIADLLAAQGMEEQSRQFGKGVEFQGIEGAMAARQQTAAQIAAAKEAELAGLAGQSDSARLQAALAEQRKNMQITNLGAMQGAGAQKEAYKLAKQEYPLRVAAQQAAIAAQPASMAQAQMMKDKNSGSSTFGNILGGVAVGGGLLQAAGGLGGIANAASTVGGWFRDGGLIPRDLRRYAGGGLADLQPQYYSKYER